MELTNNTVYRGFLTHIRSLARKLAARHFERLNHPDADDRTPPMSDTARNIQRQWEALRRDTEKVLGVTLVPWHELAVKSDFVVSENPPVGSGNMGDPLRIRMGVLKKRADKARRKDPTITLLKSWDK